jgi:hypothetical protein
MALQPKQEFNPAEWWKTGGLAINSEGTSSLDPRDFFMSTATGAGINEGDFSTGPNGPQLNFNTELPPWAAGMGITTPESAYNFFQQYGGSPLWDAVVAQGEGNQQRLDDSLNRLLGTEARVQGELDRFDQDPNRALVEQRLTERTDPNFSLLTDKERTAIDLQLAQVTAQARNDAGANAAGRGTASGGLAQQLDTGIATLGAVGGVQIDAAQDAADAAAREQAVSDLGSLSFAEAGVRAQYSGDLADVEKNIAATEAGLLIEPFDPVSLDSANRAITQYEDAIEQIRVNNERLDQEAEIDPLEWASLALQFINAGGGVFIENILEMFTGGSDR